MRIGGLFLHFGAHGVPINFNRSFALQLLMEERALLYSFMGLWPYSMTLQRKAKSTVVLGGMEGRKNEVVVVEGEAPAL